MRWLLVVPLVAGCSAPLSPSLPLTIAAAPESDSTALAPCDLPRSTAAPVLVPMPETGPCKSAPCLRPLRVAVFNPNDTPIYVTETHAFGDDDDGALVLAYDPAVVVPPGERLRMPRAPHTRPLLSKNIRVVYTDGFGHEAFAEVPYNTASPNQRVSTWAGVAPVCIAPSPPPAPTLVLSAPAQAEGPRSIHVHNDSPHRVRLIEAWVDSPRYTTVYGWHTSMLYVQPGESMTLPRTMTFDHEGQHRLRLAYVDGWARHHEAHLLIVSK